MDIYKNAWIGAIVLTLLPMTALGDTFITDSLGNRLDLNYNDYGFISFGVDLDAGYSKLITFSSWTYITDSQIYARVASDDAYGSSLAVFRINCWPGNATTDINLSQVSGTWQSYGYAFFNVPTSFISFNTSAMMNATGFYTSRCSFAMFDENATLQLYVSPKTTSDIIFPSPNPDLADIIGEITTINGTVHKTGAVGIISAGFDIIDLMLMLTAMVIIITMLIFLVLFFEFFIKVLRGET